MKSYKITQNQMDAVRKGLERFIKYVNEFCMDYSEYFVDMNKTNELYKQNPNGFFQSLNIDQEKFFDFYRDYQLLQIAEKTLQELENIHTNVIGLFINPSTDVETYNCNVRKWLYDFRNFCFDDAGNFLSLEKQNERLAKYPHFDASTKRPKTFTSQ